MSIEKVKEYLKQYGLDNEVLELDSSSATVELAAKAVGTNPDNIAKSLSFIVDDKPILILVSGNTRISNPKFKQTFHTKAKMIPASKVEELIGHNVGGVCPFGINENVDIYLDESLKKHETIYPAAGSSNSAIKLTVDKLEEIIPVKAWIDIGK